MNETTPKVEYLSQGTALRRCLLYKESTHIRTMCVLFIQNRPKSMITRFSPHSRRRRFALLASMRNF